MGQGSEGITNSQNIKSVNIQCLKQAKQFQGTSPSLHIQITQANKLLRLHFLKCFCCCYFISL